MNINRDYLIINDVKKSNVKLDNGSIFFYITDKNTQNIFVNLVINISKNDLIQKYANIENAEDYTLTINIVKPDNTYKIIEGKLHDKENAIFEFDLKEECVDKVGTYRCELLTKCTIDDHEEITTSNKLTYKVKASVLNDLDDIVEAPEYPLVIQLFDKLSDIEQYEEDRRTNELARQLAEQQRQTRFDALDADVTDSIQAMDDKVVEVESRISAKEEAVDTLIVNAKADIDEYKVAKDQEIDEYKTAKDTEINEAIANQDTTINAQNDKISAVENNVVAQNNKLDTLETKVTTHETRITATEAKNAEQDGRLDVAENRLANIGNDITNTMQPIIDAHTSRLDAIEAIDVSQNNRLDIIEAKNQEQDDRLLDIEKVNKKQDIDIKCLYGASQTIDATEEGNSIHLQNSNNGFAVIDEIKGNTLVNCNKEPDKELILNGNINTSGDNTVTLTEGVDGGLVDVALEGNTLVNVSKTKDSTAITKAYTVENSGNHIALQGDVDGDCRPVITGKTLVNLVQGYAKGSTVAYTTDNKMFTSNLVANRCHIYSNLVKPNTKYTLLTFGSLISTGEFQQGMANNGFISTTITTIKDGIYTLVTDVNCVSIACNLKFADDSEINYNTQKVILLEGDYTNKPIPDYFTGLQSSFEDNLVTQEMVDNGEEVADNLGKYKVEYKVTGKNKFNPVWRDGYAINFDNGDLYVANSWSATTNYTKVTPGKTYCMNVSSSISTFFAVKYDKNFKAIGGNQHWDKITIPKGCEYLRFYVLTLNKDKFTQFEEGEAITSYEPYKEHTKTLYLNSPLLEGDTIEEKDNGIYHVHRSELSAYIEGDEASLITDKVNTLHGLETPIYELIEQSSLTIPSYANGHLDFNTAVPVKKVEFKPFSEELTYLYANTKYTVQFISTRAILADYYLGGALLLSQNIVEGLNRISITTPSELVDNKLTINGNDTGANIMEVIVTDADREFEYFEGMKSVGEGKELQVISINSERRLVNTQRLTHEPLRGTRDAKDRYVLIDGNWYIERNHGSATFDGSDDEGWSKENTYPNGITPFYLQNNSMKKLPTYINAILCNKLKVIAGHQAFPPDNCISGYGNVNKYPNKNWIYIFIKVDTIDNLKQWLQQNPITVVYPLAEPVYEPINYNPLEVYSDVTHITTNSLIPTNIIVKNHGYNCLLKPSTTYTISSNLGLNTVTTPSTLTEDCLRFMDTDTSDVTTMKDVLVLEGDWTSKADLIPANFSGIESAFEQELVTDENDTNYGKYKVNVKVANEDKTRENNITFYINEPLRGVGDVKDRVFIKDDKLVVQRNITERIIDDTTSVDRGITNDKFTRFTVYHEGVRYPDHKLIKCSGFPTAGDLQNAETILINTDRIVFSIANVKLESKDVESFKKWLKEHPQKVQFKSPEPTYEEVDYNDTKLFIESFKNSTLFYNSNVPVTSKLYYSYSVPIVDTVAQTANVTDQQDSMIIDLATQVAVMEMMLM